MDSFSEVFNLVKERCKTMMSDTAYTCWIKPIQPLELDEDTVYLYVPNSFQKSLLERQYDAKLKDCFKEVLGFDVKIVIQTEMDPQKQGSVQEKAPSVPAQPEPKENPPQTPAAKKEGNEENLRGDFNDGNYDYTFETFIVGPSNDFTYAACKAVAQNTDNSYNPLFIHGPSGLGKTHLLCAIRHEILKNHPNTKIIYTNCETFTNEMISSIGNKMKMDQFHNKYRTADVLLIDDIQFLAGKESTQEEFFHTFNELHQAGKQIVLTSDRPPKDIATLSARLQSRFESGLITDVSLPNFETRLAIIKRKAELLNITIPNDVAEYIANKLRNNIRQLEGVVKKIKAYKLLTGSNPSIGVAQNAIKEILNDNQPVPVTVERIVEEVSKTYSVSPDDIRSYKKTANISIARQIAIYVIREITQMSQEAIGAEFNGRNHATIAYTIKKMEEILEKDPKTKAVVNDIIKNIRNNG